MAWCFREVSFFYPCNSLRGLHFSLSLTCEGDHNDFTILLNSVMPIHKTQVYLLILGTDFNLLKLTFALQVELY